MPIRVAIKERLGLLIPGFARLVTFDLLSLVREHPTVKGPFHRGDRIAPTSDSTVNKVASKRPSPTWPDTHATP